MSISGYYHDLMRVSVILPTKNRIDLLKIAIKSIVSQTYQPYEIIIIDDGSDGDDILDLIEEINEPKIKLLRHKLSKGANYSRNIGIKNSTGEYIAFLDDDDYWLPQKLEKQIEIFKKKDVGAVYCGFDYYDVITGEKKISNRLNYASGNIFEKLLVEDITAGTPTYLIRRDCFEKSGYFDEELPARQDWDMWIRIAQHYHIGCVPEVLVYAGEHPGKRISIRNYKKQIEANRLVYEKYKAVRSQLDPVIEKRAATVLYFNTGAAMVSDGEYLKGFIFHLKGIKSYPFYLANYLGIIKILLPIRLKVVLRRFLWKLRGSVPHRSRGQKPSELIDKS